MQGTMIGRGGINKAVLQIIAVIAMIIDHTAMFVGTPWIYFLMHTVGRMTIIIMCYFVAEGYYKTRNVYKYILRMAVFAAISQIPYFLYKFAGNIPAGIVPFCANMFYTRNVIFTLFVGLMLLAVQKSDYHIIIKLVAVLASARLVKSSDWGYYAVLWIVGLGFFYGSKRKQLLWIAFVIMIRMIVSAVPIIVTAVNTSTITYFSIYSWLTGLGGLGALALLAFYNGEKGNMPRYTFYVFYPLHLLILAVYIMAGM